MQWDWSQNDITFDQNCWSFDGYNGCVKDTGSVATGGGAGHTGGVIREYDEDIILKLKQIREEDDLIIEFIKRVLTMGLL